MNCYKCNYEFKEGDNIYMIEVYSVEYPEIDFQEQIKIKQYCENCYFKIII